MYVLIGLANKTDPTLFAFSAAVAWVFSNQQGRADAGENGGLVPDN